MKILFAVHRYPPFVGGSEEVSRRIVEHLTEQGHQVTVATGHNKARSHSSSPKVRSFRLQQAPVWPETQPGDRSEALAYRALFEEEWDVRFIYSAQSWTLNAVWDLVGNSSAADILAPNGYSLLRDPSMTGYFELIEQLLPRFAKVLYHSRAYQDFEFAERKGLIDNAVVIPNGTDLPSTVESADIKHSNATPVTMVTVGSHVRSKGHLDFTRASRQTGLKGSLVAPRPTTTRELIRGCYLWCRARCAVSSTTDLIDGSKPGVVDREVRKAQLFFLPSKVENAPLVILEAMARNTPWVCYDVGSVRSLPGGVVVNSYAEGVDVLQDLAKDPERRLELALAGRSSIEHDYTWDRVLPQYDELIGSLERG